MWPVPFRVAPVPFSLGLIAKQEAFGACVLPSDTGQPSFFDPVNPTGTRQVTEMFSAERGDLNPHEIVDSIQNDRRGCSPISDAMGTVPSLEQLDQLFLWMRTVNGAVLNKSTEPSVTHGFRFRI